VRQPSHPRGGNILEQHAIIGKFSGASMAKDLGSVHTACANDLRPAKTPTHLCWAQMARAVICITASSKHLSVDI
jgi:hypothetical protein